MCAHKKLTAIANAIRGKTGKTDKFTLTSMAEEIEALDIGGGYDDGFSDGKQAEHDTFWDSLQNGGAPADYSATFGAAWTAEAFRPKNNIVPSNAYMMFRQNKMEIDLAEHLKKLGVTLDTSQCQNCQYMFSSAKFTRIGVIDLSSVTQPIPGDALFSNCGNLVTIDSIIFKAGSGGTFGRSCFSGCTALEKLHLVGIEGSPNLIHDIDLHWSTRLSRDSIENVCWQAWGAVVDGEAYPVVTLSREAVDRAYETEEGALDGTTSPAWTELINGRWSMVQITLV